MKLRITFVIIAISVLTACYFYYSKTEIIQMEFIIQFKNPSNKRLDSGGLIFRDTSIHTVNRYIHQWYGDSLIIGNEIDFRKYDYIIGFGRPVHEAYYYKRISHPRDGCGYIKNLVPVTVEYQEEYTDSIYFYKIEKGKFRSLCP